MARLAFTPAHQKGSPREVYQMCLFDERFMLYMIDRRAQSHTLVWTGRISLADLLDWDERLVHLTRPASEQRLRRHARQCIADLELATRHGIETYHLEFDNAEHRSIKGLARQPLCYAAIDHVPFDLCASNGDDEQNSSISVGMHRYKPFPQEIFDFYRQTRLTDIRISRSDRQRILERIALLARPVRGENPSPKSSYTLPSDPRS